MKTGIIYMMRQTAHRNPPGSNSQLGENVTAGTSSDYPIARNRKLEKTVAKLAKSVLAKSSKRRKYKPIFAKKKTPKDEQSKAGACQLCSLLVPCSNQDFHEMVYHSQSQNCQLIFDSYSALMQQNISVHGAEMEQCAECNARFSAPTDLMGHLYDHAVTKAGMKQPLPVAGSIGETVGVGPGMYSGGSSNLTQPQASMSNHPPSSECTTRKMTFKKRNGSQPSIPSKRKGKKDILCELCGDLFSCQRTIDNHVRIVHKKIHRFKCSICDKAFGQKCQLELHKGRHKPYICPYCNKPIADKVFFKRHVQAHRTGEKPFKCDQCGRGFMAKFYLKHHQYTHQFQKKPFSCTVCGRQFMGQQYLQNHMARHAGSKEFKCHICGRDYYSERDLKSHMRHHDPYKRHLCDLCGKAFRDNSKLKRHRNSQHNVVSDLLNSLE